MVGGGALPIRSFIFILNWTRRCIAISTALFGTKVPMREAAAEWTKDVIVETVEGVVEASSAGLTEARVVADAGRGVDQRKGNLGLGGTTSCCRVVVGRVGHISVERLRQ
jgi:hypothetical protein